MHFKDKFRLWSEAWICQEIFIRFVNIIEKKKPFYFVQFLFSAFTDTET